MKKTPIITLTTDFGYKDPFVGVMKGVILKINPRVNIVDITHDITPHNIKEAAITIGMSYKFFPDGTIHIVVDDPGVGSKRKPIIVATEQYYFIGPDNGVFTQIFNLKHESLKVIHITSEHYFLEQRGTTFHGRDIFAPVAAWLSTGINVSEFGNTITDYFKLPIPRPKFIKESEIIGEIIHIDRFGNAITNVTVDDINSLSSVKPDVLKVTYKDKDIPLLNYYAEAKDNGLSAILNSSDNLELFVYQNSASKSFNIAIGDNVKVALI